MTPLPARRLIVGARPQHFVDAVGQGPGHRCLRHIGWLSAPQPTIALRERIGALHGAKDRWGRVFPSAVAILEKNLDSLLTFFQFDATYWTVLRTNHPIERLNKEFKRRTRAMEVTGNEISTYRCLFYVAQTMEYRWNFHSLSQWSRVYTQIAA